MGAGSLTLLAAMGEDAIVFALANPTPEIDPAVARRTARVDGDVRATALMAEVLAEMVAPCVVLRVGCDPQSTATPLAPSRSPAAPRCRCGTQTRTSTVWTP